MRVRLGVVWPILLGALCAGLLLVRSRTTTKPVPVGLEAAVRSDDRVAGSRSNPVDSFAAPDGGLTHVDRQRRAEMLRELLVLLQPDEEQRSTPDGKAPSAAARPRFRTTNDVEAAARFIQERIRNDFVPMAKGCYQELLRRKPEVEGDVVVGFEILGDESVGGVVNSAEIRDESTLRDESLETCLRESFLAVYFDPPPGGARATIRFPFHFAHGDVDGSHELHLRDRRGEPPPSTPP